jgi:hypothetical protein
MTLTAYAITDGLIITMQDHRGTAMQTTLPPADAQRLAELIQAAWPQETPNVR